MRTQMASSNGSRSKLLKLPHILVTLLLCFLVSACGHPDARPVDMGKGASLSTGSGWLLPAGSYHMVTTRPSPMDSSQQILCTEPSPDWAVAFGEALQLSAEGKAPSGIDASLSGSSSDTETVTALVGRTAGVVSLRDGLYAACQAYANHIIGKDAYGLIISQYGDLLVALAGNATSGGTGATSTGGAAAPAVPGTPAGVAVAVTTGSLSGTGSAASTTKPPTTGTSPDAQVALVQQEILQGLITVCLTNSDPTEKSSAQLNQLIDKNTCSALIGHVIDASVGLLKPQVSSSPPPSAVKGAAVADPAILTMQLQLNKVGAGLKPDGIYGPKTKAAMLKYPNAV
jgi:hypothetical protein